MMAERKLANRWYRWLDRLADLLLLICGIAVLWVLLQVFCLTSFRIPSDSMEPVLRPGDAVLVGKWTYGPRLFNVLEAINGKQVHIHRLPGWGQVERNDVIVFNNPCPRQWRKMEMDIMQYYVKRCVALPGDTFRIVEGIFKVDGYDGRLGCVEAQKCFFEQAGRGQLPDDNVLMRAYPGDSLAGWTVLDFGPLYIPRAGDCIRMDALNFSLYKEVIEWEQETTLVHDEEGYRLGNRLIRDYRFLKNYYFVAGDKVSNSKDSRYWGLLPEEYIVGKVWRIWKSVDLYTGAWKWDRIWEKVE